jgi:hypothetical protein
MDGRPHCGRYLAPSSREQHGQTQVMSEWVAIVTAAVVALWGVAHIIPTRSVVSGFGSISVDNRRVITQEWLVEAFAMWFIAAVVILAAVTAQPGSMTSDWIYRASAAVLLAVGGITALTGARTAVIWFKICPVLLTITAIALLVASFI